MTYLKLRKTMTLAKLNKFTNVFYIVGISIFVLAKPKLFGLLPVSNIIISVWGVFTESTKYLLLERQMALT